jgi:hypothetical protein
VLACLFFGPACAFAQTAWAPLWGNSAEPGHKGTYALVRQCEAGYWVNYALESNRAPVTASGQSCNPKTQACYAPGSKMITVRHPQTRTCRPDGARCQWHERVLPNGAWQRKMLCNPEVTRR